AGTSASTRTRDSGSSVTVVVTSAAMSSDDTVAPDARPLRDMARLWPAGPSRRRGRRLGRAARPLAARRGSGQEARDQAGVDEVGARLVSGGVLRETADHPLRVLEVVPARDLEDDGLLRREAHVLVDLGLARHLRVAAVAALEGRVAVPAVDDAGGGEDGS